MITRPLRPKAVEVCPTDDDIIRRAYELMVRRGGDPGNLFRRAEQDLLRSAAREICRPFRRQ